MKLSWRGSHLILAGFAGKREDLVTTEEIYIANALAVWKNNIIRAEKLFFSLQKEQLETEAAPGRNRLVYLWGHLTAVHDRMIEMLGFGERVNPSLDAIFISAPDRTKDTPDASEIRGSWEKINERLSEGFVQLTPEQWLAKHSAVSDEDFAKDPLRNRLAILLTRTNHLSYHLGQALLARH
jgi:hypothetical protein